MRKTFFALTAVALLAGACSRKSGGGVKLKADTDSVAYIIGMNVGMNLLKMDSTLNVNAVCEGIRDVFRAGAKLSAGRCRALLPSLHELRAARKGACLRGAVPRRLCQIEPQLCPYAVGVTYTVEVLGDQEQIPVSDRDSVALRYIIRTADGADVYSSYERRDTLRTSLGSLGKE